MSFDPVNPPYNSTDPSATFLSSSVLDFLLIELVPLAVRVSQERDRSHDNNNDFSQRGMVVTSGVVGHASVSIGATDNNSTVNTSAGGVSVRKHDGDSQEDEEQMESVYYRLESQGYRVGQGLVERFSRDRPRFNDTLDVIKFLCKDLWSLVFGKNIDNLKTNHRGVYVLTDNVFRPFSRMSTETGGQAIIRAQPFLRFPCGIVRGALAALGISATVQAEINALPGAIFQIKTMSPKT